MYKNVFLYLLVLITTFSYAQSNSITKTINADATYTNKNVKLKNISIEVSVDSQEELKTTFTTNGIEELIEKAEPNEELSFKIICNSKTIDGVKSQISYQVKGNTNEKEDFIKNIEKLRRYAIKYYQNKN